MRSKVLFCLRSFMFVCCTFRYSLVFPAIAGALASTGGPYFIDEPSDTYAESGNPAVLNCLTGGNIKSAIAWRRNGFLLDLSRDGRRMIKPNGSLYFSEIIHDEDEGTYQCEALSSNDMGLDYQILSRTSRLIVADISSKVAVTPSTLQVPFGDTSRLYCAVKQSTPTAVVRWKKQGQRGFITTGGRFTLTPDGVLQIADSKFEDQGQYACTAENPVTSATYKSVNSGSLQITVEYGLRRGPTFFATPKDRVAVVGSKVILECIANGFPKPKVTWLRDGLPVVFGSDYSLLGKSNLLIESVSVAHAGIYTCRALAGARVQQATAKLDVHYAPVFIKKPKDVHAYSDSNALFECLADGIPKPDITWRRNGDILENSDFNTIGYGFLLVKMLVLSDMGPYQCFAENSLGKVQATAELAVYMKGQPLPQQLTTNALDITTTSDTTTSPDATTTQGTTVSSDTTPDTTTTSRNVAVSGTTVVPLTTTSQNATTASDAITVTGSPVYSDTTSVSDTTTTSGAMTATGATLVPISTKSPNIRTSLDTTTVPSTPIISEITPVQGTIATSGTINVPGNTVVPVSTTSTIVTTTSDTTTIPGIRLFSETTTSSETTGYLDTLTTVPDVKATPDAAKAPKTTDITTIQDTTTASRGTVNSFTTAVTKTPNTMTTETNIIETSDATTFSDVTTVPDISEPPKSTTQNTKASSENTANLVVTKTAEVTGTSEVTAIPDITATRDVIASPDITTTPDFTANGDIISPEITAAPGFTTTPGTLVAPGGTFNPRFTTISDTTNSIPDATTAQENIPVSYSTEIPGTTSSYVTLVSDATEAPDTITSSDTTTILDSTETPGSITSSDITPVSDSTETPGTRSATPFSDATETPDNMTSSDTTPVSDSTETPGTTSSNVTTVSDATEIPDTTKSSDTTPVSDSTESQGTTSATPVSDATETPDTTSSYTTLVAYVAETLDASTSPDITVTPDITTSPDAITTSEIYANRDAKTKMSQAPKPPGTQIYIRKKRVREGREKVIKCVATASHKPDVNWYRKGKKLGTTKCTHPNDVSCQDIIYEVYEEKKPQALQSTRARTIQVLKIRSALYPRDQGKFECIATNGHALPAKLIIDLDVQAPPRLMKKQDQVLSRNGQNSKVDCVLDKGNPLPTFKWEYQNMVCPDFDTRKCQPVETQWMPVPERAIITPKQKPTNGSIIKVQSDQTAALYRCQAFNNLGSDSHVIKFVRREHLAFVKQPQNVLRGYIGQRLVINCSTNDEDASVSLLHKRHPFAAFSKRKPSANKLWKKRQVFYLLKLDLRDAGIYTCEASNRANETIRWPAGTGYLMLSREPLAFLKPPPIILGGYVGQKVEVDCSTNDEAAKVSLLHKNHPLAAFSKREIKENKLSKRGQVFTLLNVDLSDGGIYACEAKNQASRLIRWPSGTGYLILFRVEIPRHFVLIPTTPVIVPQGREAKVICESEGVSVTKLKWKKQTTKGDVTVPDKMVAVVKDRPNNRVRATLTITNAQPQDGGVYKCVLMVFDKTDYKQTTILVKEPLAFLMQPKTILLGYLGKNLEINCSTNDENATVSLLHKRHSLGVFTKRTPEPNKLSIQRKVFTLLNLDLRDSGMYSCEAKDRENNRIRWPLGTGYLIVIQAELPDYFVLKPEKPVIVVKGQDVNITCESEGVQITKLQWKKQTDSGEVSVPEDIVTIIKDRSTNRVRAVLNITNAKVEDAGVYKCVLRVFEKTAYRFTRIKIDND